MCKSALRAWTRMLSDKKDREGDYYYYYYYYITTFSTCTTHDGRLHYYARLELSTGSLRILELYAATGFPGQLRAV
eukprot:10155902-Heterocapsa_arctica.AAC.1